MYEYFKVSESPIATQWSHLAGSNYAIFLKSSSGSYALCKLQVLNKSFEITFLEKQNVDP